MPGSTPFTPKAITRYPNARNNSPSDCFTGEAGSMFLCPSLSQSDENSGAKSTTNTGLKDWKKLAGISQPKNERSVCSSAK